jgi:carotenoid cleavage dioxygenase-like enzyme
MTATAADTTATADYTIGFDTQDRELSADRLPVTGTLPAWLTGALVRTGPAQFEVGERQMNHWFDGLAMLHRFGFAGGEVSYANKFLQTRAYRDAHKTGRISYSEFATDPCRTLFQRVASIFSAAQTDNAAVNVVRLGEQYIAMTETPMPVSFEADTLKTLGVTGWARALRGQLTTAHPHYDAGTGEMLNYTTHFGPATKYRVFALAPNASTPREIVSIPTRRPAYMHSFAVTERYLVLVEFPLVVNPPRLALSGRPFIENYEWEPERGTTFTVIDRAAGTLAARVPGPAMFSFHHVNAFEDGDRLVIDLCRYDDASIIDALYLSRLRSHAPVPGAQLWRYDVPLKDGGEATGEPLADATLELPRIDYRSRNGRRYRFAYGTGTSAPGEFLDQLVKLDVDNGQTSIWREPGSYPGEPVFVPAPEQRSEDDGVILSVVLDAGAQSSYLLVLDAGTFEELARAQAPLRVPFGFHGSFFRS